VCKLADIVAYVNHDVGDAIRAGIITEGDLPLSAIKTLGRLHSQRVNTMVCDIIDYSWAASGNNTGPPAIGMSPEVLAATGNLRDFLFDRVYNVRSAQQESEKAREVVRRLYRYFTGNEDRLPVEYRSYGDGLERRVVDYIAGMTDQYALRTAGELSLTKD
jgi:dGTPase